MSNYRFTPAPWYVGDQDGYLWNIHDGKARTIAETGMGNDIYADHAEANAHLIAAAPELVEALEAILDAWDNPRIDDPPGVLDELAYGKTAKLGGTFDERQGPIEKARTALSKARGNP